MLITSWYEYLKPHNSVEIFNIKLYNCVQIICIKNN